MPGKDPLGRASWSGLAFRGRPRWMTAQFSHHMHVSDFTCRLEEWLLLRSWLRGRAVGDSDGLECLAETNARTSGAVHESSRRLVEVASSFFVSTLPERRYDCAGPARDHMTGPFKLLVDACHGSRREAQVGRQLAHGRKSSTCFKHAAGDHYFELAAELLAWSDRTVVIDADKIHVIAVVPWRR